MSHEEPRLDLDSPKQFGLLLRELRRAAGLTQAEVAHRMGYRDRGGKTAVSRLERGRRSARARPGAASMLYGCDGIEGSGIPHCPVDVERAGALAFERPTHIVAT